MTDVLMVASEASPFYKTGGLADVVGSLSAALVGEGHQVDVVIPLYEKNRPETAERIDAFQLSVGQSQYTVSVFALRSRGVRYLFLEIPRLFDRQGMYGDENGEYKDNGIRFGVFCRAAIEIVARRTSRPRLIHCHDWQTGLVPSMLAELARHEPSVADVKTVFTAHDLGQQGRFDKFVLPTLGLDWSLFNPEQLEFWGDVNFLKGGLVFSDFLTTTSPSYSKDIQTPEWGCGLDGVLRARAARLIGILTAIDYETWDPSHDPHIAQAYSHGDLVGKAACKEQLLRSFWLLGDPLVPTIGIVSAFTEGQGLELVPEIADVLLTENARLVIHGNGNPALEGSLTRFAQTYPQNVSVVVGSDDVLAHKIYAGADILLVPSRYEPAGLGQFYGMRYGTIPVVRAAGSADDSVTEETGFKFSDYTSTALAQSLREACTAYHERPYHWRRMMIRSMQQDFSWDRCAKAYSMLYASLGVEIRKA